MTFRVSANGLREAGQVHTLHLVVLIYRARPQDQALTFKKEELYAIFL